MWSLSQRLSDSKNSSLDDVGSAGWCATAPGCGLWTRPAPKFPSAPREDGGLVDLSTSTRCMTVIWGGHVKGNSGGADVGTSCLLGGETRCVCHPQLQVKPSDEQGRWWFWWLNISGEVQRVAFKFSKGDGRMLQVVEQHLHLRGGRNKTLWDYKVTFIPSLGVGWGGVAWKGLHKRINI